MLSAQRAQLVLVLAIDAQEIVLAVHVGKAQRVAPFEAVADGKRNDETLAIKRLHVEAFVESIGLRHHRDVERAVEQQLGQPYRRRFAQGQLDAGVIVAKFRQEAHEAERADRAHHAEIERRIIEAQEFLRLSLGTLRFAEDLFEMRLHQPAEIGEVRQIALPPQEKTAQLLLELLDRTRQGGLRHVAFLGGAREVERLRNCEEITDLVHLHRATPLRFLSR